MEKKWWMISILVLAAIIILFYFGNNSQPREPTECADDSDCPAQIERYCNETNSPCAFIVYYRCANSECVPYGCSLYCGQPCEDECIDGECKFPQNKSDLIIYDMINETHGELTNLSIIVKNIGNARASESKTGITNSRTGVELMRIDTRALWPQETQTLGPFTFIFAAGTSNPIMATADIANEVDESNEENNDKEISIVISPYA